MKRMDDAIFELVIPLRAEFVSIARLTVSGVANRAGFDFDEIEDIKVSLSEVCNQLIGGQAAKGREGEGNLRMRFALETGALGIRFYMDEPTEWTWSQADAGADGQAGGEGKASEDELDAMLALGPSLISLLMDEFTPNPDGECVVAMKKYIEPGR